MQGRGGIMAWACLVLGCQVCGGWICGEMVVGRANQRGAISWKVLNGILITNLDIYLSMAVVRGFLSEDWCDRSGPLEILRAGLHCPVPPPGPPSLPAPCVTILHTHPALTLAVPNSIIVATQWVVMSTGSGAPPITSWVTFNHIFQPLCAKFHRL